MKTGLQLKIGQQLTITPQLQQAIRLLLMSSQELELEIQEQLTANPMLEVQEDISSDTPTENNEAPADIPNELPVDTAWEDIYPDVQTIPNSSGNTISEDFDSWHSKEQNLQDYLLWQLNLNAFSDIERLIGLAIIDAISESGYLTTSLEDIQQSLDPQQAQGIDLHKIEGVLKQVQLFDPIGVGARNLQECMLVQLNNYPVDTPNLEHIKQLVAHHLELLGKKKYQKIKQRLKINDEQLQAMLKLISKLHPTPGDRVASNRSNYVIPDVVVRKKHDRWLVELNKGHAPNIRINPSYAAMIKRANNSRENQFLKEQMSEAKWFLKSLSNRNETLLLVASCIVEEQKAFLEKGAIAMKSLVLQDIASATGLHESTISRITTQKFIHTPQGIFELKYFFSSHLTSEEGSQHSSTAVKALIKQLIENESNQNPLSDNEIANQLKNHDIIVARRTVAKYREAMKVLPSSRRKQIC